MKTLNNTSTICLGIINELTKELDKYTRNRFFDNYIYQVQVNEKWIIRYPGSSTGCIEVKDDIITKITLYKNDRYYKIYKPDAEEALQKFIGYRFKI